MAGPLSCRSQGIADNPLAERLHQPAGLSDREKRIRQLLAEFRMVHTNQRLESREAPGTKIVLRLKMEREPCLVQSVADCLFHLQAGFNRHRHLAGEDVERLAAGRLCVAESEGRALQELGGVRPVLGRDCGTDACTRPRVARDFCADILQCVPDATSIDFSVPRAAHLRLNDRELVVTNAGDVFRLLGQDEKPLPYALQKGVAFGFAEDLVEDSKAVDVDEMHGELASGFAVALNLRRQDLQELVPFRRTRQRVARTVNTGAADDASRKRCISTSAIATAAKAAPMGTSGTSAPTSASTWTADCRAYLAESRGVTGDKQKCDSEQDKSQPGFASIVVIYWQCPLRAASPRAVATEDSRQSLIRG